MKTLYKYQQEMVDRAGVSTALFWDMGLGKTVTSLEIYKKHKLDRLFVISPLSMVEEWVREFKSQVGGNALLYKTAVKEAKKRSLTLEQYLWIEDIECLVLNYEMVWRVHDYSWVNDRTMIIADESHRFKNPSTRIGRYMKFLKVKTKYKIILSGTPQSSGYLDYYNQLYFLDKIEMTLGEFKNRYCVYENKEYRGVMVRELVGYKNVDELENEYIKKCELLKLERVYDDVVKYNYVEIPTSPAYRRVRNDRVIYYDVDGNVITNRREINKMLNGEIDSDVVEYRLLDNAGAYRYGLRSLLDSKYKQDWLRDFLSDYDKRVVVFYNYNHELASIMEICDKLGKRFGVYNGGSKNLDGFIESSDGVAIVNYKSGSFGINDLVISNVFIAYSPTDSYLEWEQSKKRIDRDGQLNTPIYYFLESGLESNIYKSLRNGKNFDDRVFVQMMLDEAR